MGKNIKDIRRLLIDYDLENDISEAYKECRIKIRASLENQSCKVVLISSAMPDEGKSITCANLAISFAAKGDKVLVIDANFRRPALQRLFEYSAPFYLENVLEEEREVRQAISITQYENLSSMQIRTLPKNPTEMIASMAMQELLKQVSKEYDYIFIDSAPINVVTDTVALVSLVPNMLLVVKQGKTKNKDFHDALEKLSFVEAKVIGVIMNDIKRERRMNIRNRKYGVK